MKLDQKKQKGFSLLEVLVAFSIFTISFTLILQVYHKASYSARLSDEYATALLLANSNLAVIGVEDFPDFGVYETNWEKYLIRTDITKISNEESDNVEQTLEKRQISVQISWPGKNKTHSIELDTIKLFPNL